MEKGLVMFDICDSVKTSKKVSKKDYVTLKQNNIKPGMGGTIVDVFFRVRFGNAVIELSGDSLENNYTKNKKDTTIVDDIMGMFGMK